MYQKRTPSSPSFWSINIRVLQAKVQELIIWTTSNLSPYRIRTEQLLRIIFLKVTVEASWETLSRSSKEEDSVSKKCEATQMRVVLASWITCLTRSEMSETNFLSKIKATFSNLREDFSSLEKNIGKLGIHRWSRSMETSNPKKFSLSAISKLIKLKGITHSQRAWTIWTQMKVAMLPAETPLSLTTSFKTKEQVATKGRGLTLWINVTDRLTDKFLLRNQSSHVTPSRWIHAARTKARASLLMLLRH